MNAPLATRSWRGDFPGVADWHYLDTAATAQKPQQVVDAIARAYGADYATVHRGVYARSANMTLAYEAARRRVAQFIDRRVTEGFDGGLLDGAHHPFGLAVGPWVIGLGEAMLDAVLQIGRASCRERVWQYV